MNNTLPQRKDGQPIDTEWYNRLRRAILTDFYPRLNTSGIVTDDSGGLGNSSYRFLNFYGYNLFLINNGKIITVVVPTLSGNLIFTLPAPPSANTYPLRMSTGGVITASQVTTAETPPVNTSSASSSTSLQTISATSYTALTSLSVSLTTHGRPVLVTVIPKVDAGYAAGDSSGYGYLSGDVTSGDGKGGLVRFTRDGTQIAVMRTVQVGNSSLGYRHIDIGDDYTGLAAGTYTYAVSAKKVGGNILTAYCTLTATEL